jgi:signal transduction histidine kinase
MNSLRVRLFAAFFAVIAVVIVVISFSLLLFLRQTTLIDRPAITRLGQALRTLPRQIALPVNPTPAEARAFVSQAAELVEARVLVVEANGVIVADSANTAEPEFNLRNSRAEAATGFRVGEAQAANGDVWLYSARRLGPGLFLVLADQQPRFPALRFFFEDLLWPLLQAAVIAALVALLLVLAISRWALGPVQQMARVAQGIARGDYSQNAPVTGPDEVRTLGQSINTMAQQVQASAQAQRDFLANVSHDLKTPLTSIQGFAQAIQDGTAESPEMVKHSAGIIYDEAERMRRLVGDLLDLARLDAGLRALNRAPVEMRLLLGSLVEKFALRAQAKDLTLETRLPAQLPVLKGDADRLAQVFTNLLDNALHHTPAGGRVTLTAEMTPAGLEVAVADTGPGLPPEALSRVFERFYQVDKSRARPAGVGLGLAISKEIVEAHHGQIRAESAPGQGARFIVRLPLALPDESTVIRKRK